jgi:REP element-mobilizing transposase RayT
MVKTIAKRESDRGFNRESRRASRDVRQQGGPRQRLSRAREPRARGIKQRTREKHGRSRTGRPARPQQLSLLDRLPKGHGGARARAGRSRSERGGVAHTKRPVLARRFPVHVTMRCHDDLPVLRDEGTCSALVRSIRAVLGRGRFRVVHYSVQPNHIHLICEANDEACLTQGVAGLTIRLARAFNRVHGRKGGLWASRYHARILRTPREVRRAIVYVLGNWRHHGGQYAPRQMVDPCSSARWFTGFAQGSAVAPRKLAPRELAPPTADAETWLLSLGWRCHGLISVDEGPWPP